mgnify:CR=1 FL=1
MIELILTLAVKFWMWTVLIAFIIIGWGINFFDKRRPNKIQFTYAEIQHMQPMKIATKDKGFFKGILLWLLSTRQWEITKDWHYKIDKEEYVIPAGFTFDGASIPKFLRSFFSPVGVLLMGGLVHDYGYKYATLLKKNKKDTIGIKDQKWMDKTFRDINIYVNGFYTMNYLSYWALRIGGFVAWNGHRKRNAKIKGVK